MRKGLKDKIMTLEHMGYNFDVCEYRIYNYIRSYVNNQKVRTKSITKIIFSKDHRQTFIKVYICYF